MLTLPIVDKIIEEFAHKNLSKVKIIGVQHILETTHAMFQALFKIGLKPDNVFILGKCYSSCQSVYNEMIADGINVDPLSFFYDAHSSFDETFENLIEKFIQNTLNSNLLLDLDTLIILDDGGKCINALTRKIDFINTNSINIKAIEQTSSGYHLIKNTSFKFPIINVARSPLKLSLESPMIAQAAVDRMLDTLIKKSIDYSSTLIIGAGAIGKAIHKNLSSNNKNKKIDIFDKNQDLNRLNNQNLHLIVPNYHLIIGCTGTTSIPVHYHSLLSKNTILVSSSSSDREFDAVHLRKKVPSHSDCHSDLKIESILLLKSGFPVNFDGERENIDPQIIQLTIALITAAILQGCLMEKQQLPNIYPVDIFMEKRIENLFKTARQI